MIDYINRSRWCQNVEVYFGDGGRDYLGAAVVTGVQQFQIGGGLGHPQGVPLRTGIQGIWTAIFVINGGWPGAAMSI